MEKIIIKLNISIKIRNNENKKELNISKAKSNQITFLIIYLINNSK